MNEKKRHDGDCPCSGDYTTHAFSCRECTCEFGQDFRGLTETRKCEAHDRRIRELELAIEEERTKSERLQKELAMTYSDCGCRHASVAPDCKQHNLTKPGFVIAPE